ncbi:hypothetical protein QQ045_002701 [Rhodiola kirilowii]
MSFKATESISLRSFCCVVSKPRSKKSKLKLSRLIRRDMCNEKAAKDLVLRNLKLYLENRSILEANEKLRQKACFLQQENTALTAEIKKKFPAGFQ